MYSVHDRGDLVETVDLVDFWQGSMVQFCFAINGLGLIPIKRSMEVTLSYRVCDNYSCE